MLIQYIDPFSCQSPAVILVPRCFRHRALSVGKAHEATCQALQQGSKPPQPASSNLRLETSSRLVSTKQSVDSRRIFRLARFVPWRSGPEQLCACQNLTATQATAACPSLVIAAQPKTSRTLRERTQTITVLQPCLTWLSPDLTLTGTGRNWARHLTTTLRTWRLHITGACAAALPRCTRVDAP
jgi:hypothetical protein